jgi:enoyl-CoA hydratase/carnithine racemase
LKEALLLGEAFFAEAALEIGRVNRLVPPQKSMAMPRRRLSEPAAREAFGAFMEKRKPDFSKI